MKPGKELDRLILEKIYFLNICKCKEQNNYIFTSHCCTCNNPILDNYNFSTDIKHALLLVEKMHKLGFHWCIEKAASSQSEHVHFVHKNQEYEKHKKEDYTVYIFKVEEISENSIGLPHNICLSAINATTKAIEDKLL